MWFWLHGLFGDDRDWRPVTDLLTGVEHVHVLLPGHRSPPAGGGTGEQRDVQPADDFDELVRLTRAIIAGALVAHEAPTWHLAGYSLGGRLAIAIATDPSPDLPPPSSLILEGAGPGLDAPAAREERRRLDDQRAATIERDGLGPFLDAWYRQPLFGISEDEARSALVARRAHQDARAMAATIRLASPGRVPSRWAALERLDVPCLYLAGERDAAYVDIAHRVATTCPAARAVIVPDAGHNAHQDNPDAVASAIRQLHHPAWPPRSDGGAP